MTRPDALARDALRDPADAAVLRAGSSLRGREAQADHARNPAPWSAEAEEEVVEAAVAVEVVEVAAEVAEVVAAAVAVAEEEEVEVEAEGRWSLGNRHDGLRRRPSSRCSRSTDSGRTSRRARRRRRR